MVLEETVAQTTQLFPLELGHHCKRLGQKTASVVP